MSLDGSQSYGERPLFTECGLIMSTIVNLPRRCASVPLLTGWLKAEPEDFVVEELPAYEFSGEGEHLFLWIEKRDVPAEQFVRHVARMLDMPARDVGVAGMKDRRAVTRQWLSVPAKLQDRVPQIETERIHVLQTARHTNKLKTGHLRGNRFEIRLRNIRNHLGAAPDPAAIAEVADAVAARGFPNYFGDQRFGHAGETLQLGLDLLSRKKSKRDIPYARRRFLFRLALSAVQSDLFNQALASRLRDGLIDTVLNGDVMEVVATGGKFIVEDATIEQPRFEAYETVTTGPLFGPKMRQPVGEPAQREATILEQAGLTAEAFVGFGDELSGTRRPFLVRPQDLIATLEDDSLRLRFILPSGVYATTLLQEWGTFTQRSEVVLPEPDPEADDPPE